MVYHPIAFHHKDLHAWEQFANYYKGLNEDSFLRWINPRWILRPKAFEITQVISRWIILRSEAIETMYSLFNSENFYIQKLSAHMNSCALPVD